MVFYHLQHYFALYDAWYDIPHVNGGCSSSFAYVLEVYDRLLNLRFTRVSEYRIIVSGRDDVLHSFCRAKALGSETIIQLSLF